MKITTETSWMTYLFNKTTSIAWELYSLGMIYHGFHAEGGSTTENTLFVATGIGSFYGSRLYSRYTDLAFYKLSYEKSFKTLQKKVESLEMLLSKDEI